MTRVESCGRLLYGTAEIRIAGVPLATLTSGDWFGTDELLRSELGGPGRTDREIVALTELELEVLSRAQFFALLRDRPGMALDVIERARGSRWC